MLTGRNILIPVDFSSYSMNALRFAAKLAACNNYKLVVLHISQTGQFEDDLHGNLSTGHLMELLEREKSLKEVKHEFVQRRGPVIREIVKVQKKYKSDLIVMGTRGATNLSRKLFGSNTTGIIEKAVCPVLAVPSECICEDIKKVVLATDQRSDTMELIEPAFKMFRPFNPELMLLYVDGDTDPGVETDYTLTDLPRRISKFVDYPQTTMHISSFNSINEGIEDFIEKKKADLLIMITRSRSIFQSIFDKSKTKKMASNVSIPLLAVPNE